MMRILLLIFCFACFGQEESAAQIDYTQHSLVSKRTASWCTNCGKYGWEMFEGVVEDTKNVPEAIALAVHYSGGLSNDIADVFIDYIGGSGQPLFYVNDREMGVFPSNVAQKRTEVLNQVASNAEVSSSIGFDAQATIVDNIIRVDIDYTFSEALSGDTKIAAYLVYNNYIFPQTSRGDDASHKRLLWDTFTSDPSGEFVSSEPNILSNLTLSLNLDDVEVSHPLEDMEVVLVAWNVENGRRAFINGRILQIEAGPVSTSSIDESKAKIYHDGNSIVSDLGNIELDPYRTEVFSLVGRKMFSQSYNVAQTRIDTPGWRPGTYIVKTYGKDWSISRKIILMK